MSTTTLFTSDSVIGAKFGILQADAGVIEQTTLTDTQPALSVIGKGNSASNALLDVKKGSTQHFNISDVGSLVSSTENTGSISLQAGSGGINMDCTQSTGNLTVDTAGGEIQIGVNAAAGAIKLGTNTTARTITIGSGANTTLDINSAVTTIDSTALSIDSTDTTNLTMTANDNGAKVMTIAATNGGSGEGQMAISATDQLTITQNAAVITMDGNAITTETTGTIGIGTTSAAGNINIGTEATARTMTIGASTTTLDIDGAGITIDGSTLSIDSTDDTNLTMTANSASAKTLLIKSLNSGSGEGKISINSDSQVDITDGTATLTLDGGALSETSLASADITPSGTLTLQGGGVSKFGDDTGFIQFNGSGAVTTSGMTNVDLDASGTIGINSSAGVISIGNDAVNQAINIATGGTRTVTLGTSTTTLDINTAGATIDSTTLSIDSTDTTNLTMTANAASTKTMTIQALNSNGSNISELKLVSDGDMKLVPGSAAGSTGATKTLIIDSTAAIKVPVGTSAQRPSAAQGQIRFNTTTGGYEGYTGSTWGSLGGVVDSAHDSNTFLIAGKVSSASVTVVDTMVSSGQVGTDDTLSFFAGTTSAPKKGFRKMTIDKDNLIVYDSSDSTTNIFKVENTGNTTIAGTLGVNGNTISSTVTGAFNLLNTNVTTLNLGGAVTTATIAAAGTAITMGAVSAGQVHIRNTSESTSETTGALRVDGGVGIKGDVFVKGGKIEIASEGSKSIIKMADDAEIQDASGHGRIKFTDAGGVILTDNAGSTELTVADGQVTIAGNLTVSGTTTIVNSTTIEVGDSMLKLAKGNDSSDAADFGIYGLYTSGGAKYAGIYRDATDSTFKLFKDLTAEPGATVTAFGSSGAARANLEIADLVMGKASASTITHTGTNGNSALGLTISSTHGHVTVEGIKFLGSNLITTGGLDLDISGGSGLDIDVTGAFTIDSSSGSNINVTGANLDLKTTTSGDINISSAADLDLDSVTLNVNSSGAMAITSASTLAITNTSSTTTMNFGGQTLDVDAATVTIDSSANTSITAGGTLGLTATSGKTTINCGSQELEIDSGALKIDSKDTTNLTMTANSNDSHKVLTISASNSGSKEGQIAITSDSQVSITDGTATLKLDGGAVTAETTGSISIGATSAAGNINIGTNNTARTTTIGAVTTTLDINSLSTTLDSNTTLSIDSKDATNLTMSADVAADRVLTIAASNANASGDGLIAINADGISGTAIKAENNMASNSATHLATQQSIKTYVDTVASNIPANAKLTTPQITDSGGDHYYKFAVSNLADSDKTITLPLLGGNDTFVFEAHTQTLSNKTLTEPKIANGGFIADANGNELMVFNTTGSAVNFLDLTNSATGNAVALAAKGTDGNISLTLASKGTGTINILGTTALKVPVGTIAQRPTAATGQIRFNSETGGFEGYTGNTWGSLGGIVDSAHGSNTFLIAGKVADASVFGSTAGAFNGSNQIGTDDTLSFFAGSVDGSNNAERGARKMIISKDNITMFSKADSTSVIFDVNNSGNTTVAGTLGVNGNTLSTTQTGTFNLLNTNATRVDFAGAATTVNIGTGAGTVNINTTTNSTSSTTGALVVDGGLGIASNFVMGGTSFTMGNGATIVNTDGNTLTVTEATLAVVGNQTLSGDLTIATNKFTVASGTGNTAVAGTLEVEGATGINGNFDINTNKFTVAHASGNTAIAGTLGVTGLSTLASLGVTNAATVGSTLDVSGNTTINNGNLTINDGSSNTFVVTAASGNTAISGTLSTTGDFKVNTDKFVVTATNGNTAVAGTLGVTGATTLSNTLTVSGSNATTLGGTLGVSGATTLNNANFTIKDGSANDKFAVIAASGNTDVKGTLDTAGDFKVNTNKFTVASATGNTTVAGTLEIAGATGINADFDIATNKFTVAHATGNTAVAGTLGVTGATTLASTLAVNGGTISTDDTSFDLLNATAETVNFAGAGTSIVMGAASAGQVHIRNTSESTSEITGALRVDGGVGIKGDVFVKGGQIEIAAGAGTKSIVKMADTAEIQDGSGNARITFTDTGNIILNNPAGDAGELTVSDAGVVITGNLTVSGTTTTVNSTTVSIADSMLKLAKDQANTADTVDFGVYGQFGDGGTHKFAGLYRDASDGIFKLFKGLTTEPADTTTAFGTDGSTRASLELGNIVMGDTGNNTITHTGGGATGLTISSTNGHVTVEGVKFTGSTLASTGGLDIDVSGGSGLDIDVTGAVNIDSSSASTVNVTGANLDIKTTTSGDININSVADLDLDGATVNVNSSTSMAITAGSTLGITATSGATTLNCAGQTLNVDAKFLQLDSTDTTNLTMTADVDSDRTLTISASNSDASGNGLIAINADGISGTAIKNEANMSSNSATHLASQQSIKAYVDAKTTSIPADALLTTPRIKELTNSHYYQFASSELADDRIVTLPLLTDNDTFVFEAHAQTLSNKTLTAPKFANAGFIADASGNEMIVFNTTGSAVNFLDLTNSATGNAIGLAAKGDDTNISFNISPKGHGTVNITGARALKVPVGVSDDRPGGANGGTAAQGQIRYNTTTSTYEGYTGTVWGSLGGVVDSSHDSNTFVIAGKVASASVKVVDGMVSSGEVGTDDTLSFFAGVASGDKKGFRKMTIDEDDLKFYTKGNSTTVKFSINDSGNTAIAGTLGVTGAATLSSTLSLSGDATFNDADLTIKDGSTNTKFSVLSASGNTDIEGTLDAAGDFKINSNKFVVTATSGNTAVAGTLDATGDFKINTNKFVVTAGSGNTSMAGNLTVSGTGSSSIGGALTVGGNTIIDNATFTLRDGTPTNKFTIDTSGNTAVAGTLGVTGAATLNSTLDVSGATGIDGDFDINTNKFTVAHASGNTSIAGTLGVAGATTLESTISIGGATTINNGNFTIKDGSIPANNKFTVTAASGNTNIAGTLDATGDFKINTNKFTVAAASGNTVAAGTLFATGDFKIATDKFTVASASGNSIAAGTFKSTGNLTVGASGSEKLTVVAASGNTSVGGTLAVTGVTTLTGLINADGGIAVDTNKFTVADTSGNVSTAGTLTVAGASTFNENVEITGSKTFTVGTGVSALGGNLTVAGTSTLSGNVSVAGTNTFTVGTGLTTLGGNLSLTGTADVGSTFRVNTNKFTVASDTGNTVVAGTLNATGNFNINTNKFQVVAASGNTTVAGTLGVTGITTMSAALNLNSTANISDTLTLSKGSGTGLSVTSDATIGGTLGVTGITTMSAALNLNSTANISDTLTLSKGSGTGLSVTSNATVGGTLGVTGLSTLTAGAKIPDNQALTLGTDDDITIKYDETTNDSIEFAANVEGQGLGMVFKADQGDDAGDTWKLNFADGGVVSFGNDIATQGTFVSQLTLTPNATVSSSTTAIGGAATVGGTLAVTGNTTMTGTLNLNEAADISGTLTLSKASGTGLSVTKNATIGGTLGVTSNTTVGGTLDVTGATGIDGDFDIATSKFTVASATGNTLVAGTLAVNAGSGTGLSVVSDATVGGTLGVTGLSTLTAGAKIPDNQTLTLGSDNDITIKYDETTNDSLEIAANVDTAGLGIVFKADQGGDAGDTWKLNFADGGIVSFGNDIASQGTFVSQLTLTPNATVANSTTAIAGNATVGKNLTVSGDLTVSGTTTTVNSTTVAVADSLLKVAKDNSGNAIDFGLYGQFNDGAAKFSGIYRDATDGFFKLFTGLTTEPTTTVSAYGSNNASRANLEIGNLLMGSTDNATFTHTSASTKTLSIVSTNGIITLNGAEGINLNGNSSEVDITTTGAVDINAGALTIDGSTVTIKGTGASKYGDDTATLDFDGSGAVSETGMTSFSITPSGAITLTGGSASGISTSAGALTLTGAGGISLASNTTLAGTLAVNGASITTDDTSFSLINTTATTVNFAGAGTTINVGAASGTGKVNIKATTDSTSATTGALVVDGGIGVAKDIFVGGNTITLGHGATIENTNANLLTITEAKVAIAGAQDISGDLDVNSKFVVTASNGNTSVGGNLTVSGTLNVTGTQSVNSMAISGSTVEIGSDGSDNNEDRGVEFKWHNGSAAKLGFFGMDDSSGQFVYIPDATQGTSNVFTGTVGSAQFSGITAPGLMTLNGTNGMKLQENGTDILDITDAAAVTFASGTGQALNITAKAASIFKSSSGNLTMQSEAANLVLDGYTGVQIDASSSGTVEINAAAGKILVGNDNVAQNIEIGNIGAARTIIVGHASSTEVELNGTLLDFNSGSGGLTMDTSGQITMTTTATNANSMVVTSGGGIDITATGAAGKDIDVTCTSGSVNFSAGEAVIDAMKFTTSAGSSGMTFSSGSLGTEFTGTGGAVYGSTSSSDTAALISVIPSSTASGVAKDSSNNVITSNGRALPCFSVDNAGNFNIGYDHTDATAAVKKKCALVLKSTSTIDTSDSDQNSARFNALSQHNKAALRIAGDVTITGKIYCPNALASSSSVRFNTEIITLTGEFEYSSGTNSGAWIPKNGSEPTFSTSGDLTFTPNNGQGSSPTTNAEGTNNKATDGWSSALVSIASASGNNQTTYNKCTAVNGMNRVNMILIRNKIRCPTNGSNVFDARAANAPKMRLFIDDLTSSDDGYTSMNGTQLCIFYEEYNASDGTNNANDPIADSGVSVRPPLLEVYFSKYKSNANNATNTYYKMVGGGVTTRTGFPGLPYAHGIVFSSGGQNIQAVAVGGKVRVTGGTGAYAFLQQQSTDGGGSSDTTGAALYSQNATNNVFYT